MRFRSSQGLRPTPQKPLSGKVIWKVKPASGIDITARFTAWVDGMSWSSVEFGGVSTIPKMTPWSSVGASSRGAWENMTSASTLTTAHAT